MLFNSIDFAIFLPIVFVLYWFVLSKNLKAQNLLILISSYIFYSWWDWRFLSLIVFSSSIDYFVGLALFNTDSSKKRKILLGISLLVNLGLLGFFKYFNFFIENFGNAFSFFGHDINSSRLNIILPIGISFFTFQTMSYTIDVYRRKLKPTKDVVSFFAFVSFFPQLVAGPIERATDLLPQFYNRRKFESARAKDGLRQFLLGLFKKIVIADNAAIYVNDVFGHYQDYSGSTLFVGAILFTIQIYGDFSGYSDMAIGISRLFGFNLRQNFAFPYFSRDVGEFWRRWHITLSSWFRDYLYIPLGGSRVKTWTKIRNVFIIFLVSGFWHGANWTFIMWGFVNALYFLPLMLRNKNRVHVNVSKVVAEGKYFPTFIEISQMIHVFFLTVIVRVFFRSETITQSFDILNKIFSYSFFNIPKKVSFFLITTILIYFLVEWVQRSKKHALQFDDINIPRYARFAFYYFIIFFIIWKGGNHQEFIYFQF